jgi:hypothetical protein
MCSWRACLAMTWSSCEHSAWLTMFVPRTRVNISLPGFAIGLLRPCHQSFNELMLRC